MFTKIGPSASTAPTAAKAITMPAVMADAMESSRRKRTPSAMSRHTRESLKRPSVRPDGGGMGMPLTMTAEKANVPASRSSGSVSACSLPPSNAALTVASRAKMAPPSGRVA